LHEYCIFPLELFGAVQEGSKRQAQKLHQPFVEFGTHRLVFFAAGPQLSRGVSFVEAVLARNQEKHRVFHGLVLGSPQTTNVDCDTGSRVSSMRLRGLAQVLSSVKATHLRNTVASLRDFVRRGRCRSARSRSLNDWYNTSREGSWVRVGQDQAVEPEPILWPAKRQFGVSKSLTGKRTPVVV
jgi:hypothetical protein